jgi:hypothetical protein
MVEVPKNATQIGEKIIGYLSEYKGETYVNIRKTYEKDGETAVGKGLTVSVSQWERIVEFVKSGDLLKHE